MGVFRIQDCLSCLQPVDDSMSMQVEDSDWRIIGYSISKRERTLAEIEQLTPEERAYHRMADAIISEESQAPDEIVDLGEELVVSRPKPSGSLRALAEAQTLTELDRAWAALSIESKTIAAEFYEIQRARLAAY